MSEQFFLAISAYKNNIGFLIDLHQKVMGKNKFTLFQILTYTRASVVISVKLIQYDTEWPNCDWFSYKTCDPKFEVCLSG